MVSVGDPLSHCTNTATTSPHPQTPPPPSSITRSSGRSMRTIRSILSQPGPSPENPPDLSDHLTDLRLGELARSSKIPPPDILDISFAFSDFSACSSDISGELQRLSSLPDPSGDKSSRTRIEPEPSLERETLSSTDIISPEDLQPTINLCVDGLNSPSVALKRSAAAKLRLLAKNRADNRALIGESGAVPALIPLLRCSDPMTQEHAVTALLNLSLHEKNKTLLVNAGAVKPLVYVLKTGTEISKQNAACALLSLALIDENKLSIGVSGAIPPLVALLLNGSSRGKKDALTTLYKVCSVKANKERAVSAGAVRVLVGLVGEQGTGLAEKAMVVLSSLAGVGIGREAIVEEGGIAAMVEAIEDGSDKVKEFAVLTLLQLCAESVAYRGLLVREGGIPPLVALSQNGTAKAKNKAETLLGYLRESRQEASSSNP